MTYQYDSLNRLISAATTGPTWGLSWSYDGFGNRNTQTVTKGSAPAYSDNINPGNNRSNNLWYDLSGNVTGVPGQTYSYDVADRLVKTTGSYGTERYGYDSGNRRVWRKKADGTEEFTLYGAGGQRVEVFRLSGTTVTTATTNVYFSGSLARTRDHASGVEKALLVDRLGSVRIQAAAQTGIQHLSYFPYGEEKGGSTANDRDKFATYSRDANTGLDYAMNRYYGNSMGRFLTPDPYGGSPTLSRPNSWNRYAYVEGDPVNYYDPRGLLLAIPGDDTPRDGGGGFWDRVSSVAAWAAGGVSPGVPQPPERPEGGGQTSMPRDAALLMPALSRALQALSLNEDCNSLFGNETTRGSKFNPSSVLTSIANKGSLGQIKFEDKGAKWGTAEAKGGLLGLPGTAASVTITINSYNDSNLYWNDANTDQNAHTLLHELGHAFDLLRGAGGSVIQSPDSGPLVDDRRSLWNNWKIDQACFGGRLGYKNPYEN